MIGRGDDWGGRRVVPATARRCASDAEVAAVVTESRRQGQHPPPVVVTGGDLHRCLGGRAGAVATTGDEATWVTCDVGEALVDGVLRVFVSHVSVGGPFPWRPLTVITNPGRLGSWDVAPRAHPGDGRLDVVEMTPGLRQRFLAWRRLPSGAHVPHPAITIAQRNATTVEASGRSVTVDGVDVGRARNVAVRVADEPVDVYVA